MTPTPRTEPATVEQTDGLRSAVRRHARWSSGWLAALIFLTPLVFTLVDDTSLRGRQIALTVWTATAVLAVGLHALATHRLLKGEVGDVARALRLRHRARGVTAIGLCLYGAGRAVTAWASRDAEQTVALVAQALALTVLAAAFFVYRRLSREAEELDPTPRPTPRRRRRRGGPPDRPAIDLGRSTGVRRP